jgi:hypothetical protein
MGEIDIMMMGDKFSKPEFCGYFAMAVYACS